MWTLIKNYTYIWSRRLRCEDKLRRRNLTCIPTRLGATKTGIVPCLLDQLLLLMCLVSEYSIKKRRNTPRISPRRKDIKVSILAFSIFLMTVRTRTQWWRTTVKRLIVNSPLPKSFRRVMDGFSFHIINWYDCNFTDNIQWT